MGLRFSGFTSLVLCLLLVLFVRDVHAGSPQAGTPAAASPGELKNLSLEELSQIEVTTPTKQAAPAFRSPMAIYIITGEDIRRSGATTIPEALRLAPGVEVARIDSNKWSIGIRGFGTRLSRDVLVLMDGRTVYTTLFAGTYWEVQDTLLEDIDRIEVIRGPGGTIWGPNAVNGVINIITKSTKDTLGPYVSVGGGSLEQGFGNARYGGGDPNGFTYRLYAKGFNRGPEYHFDRDNFDKWHGGQTGFRTDWAKGDRDSFTVSGDLYRQSDGERVGIGTYNPPYTANVDGTADLSGGNVLARWTRKLQGDDSLQIQAYYDRTNRHEPNLGEDRDTYDIDYIQHTAVGGRNRLIYGLGARASYGHFEEVASGLIFYPYNRLDYLGSAFFQDELILINNKLSVTFGTKLLKTNFTNFQFEPSIRLLYTPSEKHTIWASFTHSLRAPSRSEREFYLSSFLGYSSGLEYFARFNANPAFADEQLNGYELGYRTLLSKSLYIDIAGFVNHYHDLFSLDLEGAPYVETSLPFPDPDSNSTPPHLLLPAQFRNDLYGDTQGFEIAPEWRPVDFWRLRATYSYLDMALKQPRTIILGAGPGIVEGSSPKHEVTVGSALDIGRTIQLDLMYRYVSALPAQSAPAYSTGDARIAWRFSRHFELAAVGRDLFQPFHFEYKDTGGPVAVQRSGYGTLTWTK
ncbi:MAG: TonB-dependent receptor [Bryobacterales bacterium]|nr:TonB-dependent receptor [Bryobacterales bacterium]MBV9396347.1 TonB-dependent receptor [Bryobacterales bacterium]